MTISEDELRRWEDDWRTITAWIGVNPEDVLRLIAEVRRVRAMIARAPEAYERIQRLEAAEAQNAELRAERERERMRLAACGVVALANTPEAAAKERNMHPDYWSGSCQSVADAVDREMALRAKCDELARQLAAMREAIGDDFWAWEQEYGWNSDFWFAPRPWMKRGHPDLREVEPRLHLALSNMLKALAILVSPAPEAVP